MSSFSLPPLSALNVGMRPGIEAIIFDGNKNRKVIEMQTLIEPGATESMPAKTRDRLLVM